MTPGPQTTDLASFDAGYLPGLPPVMPGGGGRVGLAVERPGDHGDGGTGHDLAQEHHTPADGTIRHRPPQVEAQIDLFKPRVERHRETKDPDAVEQKSYQRDEATAVVQVQ